ncbi:hypothetical protein EYZ11_004691 [Aspergillus tanneri]|uniref:Major facilitator superfamily (MFS) profile domain-containing protein n=1 Tax=Aspergillus tanneri TaxID=1220188 RepID=A0A4S3JQP8_9EURO|nr:hypothetical protein EYZ11_004691 [Aspergillus tanneri]
MVGVPIGAYLAGVWIKRTSRYRTIDLIAACVVALVYLLIFFRWRNSCSTWEVFYLLPYGFAMGVLFSTQFIGMSSVAPTERVGQCIGTYYLFQQIGRILGPVFGLSLIQQVFKDSLWKSLGSVPEKQQLIQSILDNARFAIMLPKLTQEVVRSSYLTGFHLWSIVYIYIPAGDDTLSGAQLVAP